MPKRAPVLESGAKRARSSKPGATTTTAFGPHSSLGALTPMEFAAQQGDGPPEQAQGSAARPLVPPPHLGQNVNPELLINAGKSEGTPPSL